MNSTRLIQKVPKTPTPSRRRTRMMDDKDRDEAKKLCERLDWMKINGKNDLVQWENVLSYEIARIRAEAVAAERERSDSIVIDRVLTAEPESCEGASSRDKKGMRVRQIWMAWAQEQPNPKPSWLMPWKDLDEPSREVDRRIGCGLWGDGFAAGLDAFFKADRCEQEAMADERRRCAEIIRHVECVNGNETEIRRADAIAAILQGTGPANNHDHNAIVQALQNMIEYAETAIAHEKESNGHPRNKRYHDEMDADLKEAKTVLKELESNG
jgi:hypothetical protein